MRRTLWHNTWHGYGCAYILGAFAKVRRRLDGEQPPLVLVARILFTVFVIVSMVWGRQSFVQPGLIILVNNK